MYSFLKKLTLSFVRGSWIRIRLPSSCFISIHIYPNISTFVFNSHYSIKDTLLYSNKKPTLDPPTQVQTFMRLFLTVKTILLLFFNNCSLRLVLNTNLSLQLLFLLCGFLEMLKPLRYLTLRVTSCLYWYRSFRST